MKTTALPESTLTKHQVKTFPARTYKDEYGKTRFATAQLRYDDECGNGHNSFAITGTEGFCDVGGKPVRAESFGCCHKAIAKVFPELAHLIKWHLTGADGPMHYIVNTVYLAGNRDHRGLLKGEKRQLRNGKTKQGVWERVVRNEKGESVAVGKWIDSDEAPKELLTVAWEPVWIVGEGKEREATDEQLCASPEELERMLLERLPTLMAEFKRDIESIGFTY
jgi:hypothetical protein